MILAIDVGNTNTVFAIFEKNQKLAQWRCSTSEERTADEYFVWLKSLMDLNVAIINVHSSGGKDMMKAAVRARNEYKDSSTKIIAVTVLTSLDDQDLNEIGFISESQDLVLKLAKLTKESGLDGIVCSAKEIALIKNNIGKDFTLVVPGIRLNNENLNDQKRVMSPGDAIKEGADLLVIGRPITDSHSPIDTINEILNQIDL